MALFKRLDCIWPPDGLIEISEKVYFFYCCVSTKVLKEDEYKVYIDSTDWPSSDTLLDLDCIILRFLPLFGEKGCRPVIRIYEEGLVVEEWWMKLKMMVKMGGCRWCGMKKRWVVI
ncbi:hypothetical protein Hanom_Chr07g00632891 [Helianthus anomalus]